jgi:hypothetical protein
VHVMADKRNTGTMQKKRERDTAIRFDKQNRQSVQKIDDRCKQTDRRQDR